MSFELKDFKLKWQGPWKDRTAYSKNDIVSWKGKSYRCIQDCPIAYTISNDGLVIGSDQGLDLNGKLINKAKNFDEAHEQLKSMSGKEHTLITTTVVAKENNIIWKYVDRGKMKMRILDEEVIKEYLESVDEKILGLVGVYAIEEEGIKLFERVGSDLFSIQGISMIPLTQFLWDNGMLFENNGH